MVAPASTMTQLGVNDDAARMRTTLVAGCAEDGCAGGGSLRWESQEPQSPTASGNASRIPRLSFME
jgi:hypothetical protein